MWSKGEERAGQCEVKERRGQGQCGVQERRGRG